MLNNTCIAELFFFQTGLTALHVAAQYGKIDVVREMLLKVAGTIKSESPAMMESDKAGPRPDVSRHICSTINPWLN